MSSKSMPALSIGLFFSKNQTTFFHRCAMLSAIAAALASARPIAVDKAAVLAVRKHLGMRLAGEYHIHELRIRVLVFGDSLRRQ